MISLPVNIYDLNYVCSYKNESTGKISHLFVYEQFIFNLEKEDEYYFEVYYYKKKDDTPEPIFAKVDTLDYLNYKYETIEINELLKSLNLMFKDFDTTMTEMINKTLVYQRKYKIKKLIQ